MIIPIPKNHKRRKMVSFTVSADSSYIPNIKDKNIITRKRISHHIINTENNFGESNKSKNLFYKKYSTPKLKNYRKSKRNCLSQIYTNYLTNPKIMRNFNILKRSNFLKKKKSISKNILKNDNENEKIYDKDMIKYIKNKLGYKDNFPVEKMMFNEKINFYVNRYMEDFIYKKPKEIEIELKKSFTIFLNENMPIIFYYHININEKNELSRFEISFLKRIQY